MAAQCYPRRLPILRKEVDLPAGPTLLHDFERFSTLCSSCSSSEGVSEDVSPVMRKPHVAHDTSASKGLPCSEVQHLPPDHRLFLRRVASASLRHSSCWLSCAFPRQPKGPEKDTFFSTQKGPSQAVCRLFILAPLTVNRPRTGAESAKNTVNPNVSTLTGTNKITLIPLQTFQRLRQSSHWTFQMFFRHAQAGSGGFFPGCFFDEPGDKLCLLHLLPLSWLTKDSPFDSMCRLFFFRPHCLVQFFMVVVHRFPLLSLDSLVKGLAEGMPIRIDQRDPYRSSPLLVVSMKVRRTPSSCARSVTSSASSRMTSDEKPAVNIGCTTWKDSMPWHKPPYHCFVIIHCDERPEPVHDTFATSSLLPHCQH